VISAETIEQIRQRSDLATLAGEYVSLRKRGVNFVGLCPFHMEQHPSFAVHPERRIWHCFGCGLGGDVFDFIARVERTDFLGAAKLLAVRAGVCFEGVSKDEARRLRTDRKRNSEAASKLAELERKAFLEARENCHQLEKLRRLAAARLKKIRDGDGERFEGEIDLPWFALAEVAAQITKAAAAYSLMAFGTLDQRIDFTIHPEHRETLLGEVLEVGFVANEQGVRHEVVL
jgi:hypothetical protein